MNRIIESPRSIEDARSDREEEPTLPDNLRSIISEAEVEELRFLREFYKRNSV